MQTAALRSLCTLILCLSFLHKVNCSFHDVTSKVGVSSVDGVVAAFGDFNGDKSTDLFVITNQGKQLDVILWNEGSQKFSSSSSLVTFKSSIIVNVAPGDFDGDGCMDIMVTTEAEKTEADNIKPKKVHVFWGNLKDLSSIDHSFTVTEDLKDQPVILDVNGDLIPDFFGTIYNKDNASLEERTYWVSPRRKNRTFIAQVQTASSENKEKNKQITLAPVKIPHSNAFLDVTGDMTADFFITSKTKNSYKFEIWENKEGVLTYSPDSKYNIGLPDDVSDSAIIGQSSFADFDETQNVISEDEIRRICQELFGETSYGIIFHPDQGKCPARGDHYHVICQGPLDGDPSIPVSRCRFYRWFSNRHHRVTGRKCYGSILNFIRYLLRPPRIHIESTGAIKEMVETIQRENEIMERTRRGENVPNNNDQDQADGAAPMQDEPEPIMHGNHFHAMNIQEDEEIMEPPQAKKKKTKAGDKNRLLQRYIYESRSRSTGQLIRWARGKGEESDEWIFVHDVLGCTGMRDFEQRFRFALDMIFSEYLDKTWQEMLDLSSSMRDDLYSTFKYHSIAMSRIIIARWFEEENIDIWSFCEDMIDVIDKRAKKINTVVFQGQKNSGKTLVLQSLIENLQAIGIITNNASATFTWQDVLNKRVILAEEVIIGTNQTEEFKSIMGGEDVMVNVKNKNQALLERTPVFITCNALPWCAVGDSDVYEARCKMYKKLRTKDWLHKYTKRIHPIVWKYYVDAIMFQRNEMEFVMGDNNRLTPIEDEPPPIPDKYLVINRADVPDNNLNVLMDAIE